MLSTSLYTSSSVHYKSIDRKFCHHKDNGPEEIKKNISYRVPIECLDFPWELYMFPLSKEKSPVKTVKKVSGKKMSGEVNV